MTNTTWAAKVLDGVPRWSAFQTRDVADRATDLTDRKWLRYDDALAAIARMGTGDGLVERLQTSCNCNFPETTCGAEDQCRLSFEAADHITALTAQVAEAGKMLAEQNSGYNRKTNDLIERHAKQIADLTAQVAEKEEQLVSVLQREAATQQRHDAKMEAADARAERDALRAKVARLEGALTDMPKAVLRTTVCQGPVWPDDRPGVWLAALEACAKSVQEAVDAALTDGGKDG